MKKISLLVISILLVSTLAFAHREHSGRGHSNHSRSSSYYSGSYSSSSEAVSGVARDGHGRIERNEDAKSDFMKETGYPNGRPGYVIDHVVPLAVEALMPRVICSGKQ